jgi:hypothetical protein
MSRLAARAPLGCVGYQMRLLGTDLVAAALAAFLEYKVRFTMVNVEVNTTGELRAYFVGALVLPVLWLGFVAESLLRGPLHRRRIGRVPARVPGLPLPNRGCLDHVLRDEG